MFSDETLESVTVGTDWRSSQQGPLEEVRLGPARFGPEVQNNKLEGFNCNKKVLLPAPEELSD